MSGEWKFRFLDRTDSRRCRSLIRSAASGSCSFKSDIQILISSGASGASAFTLDDAQIKQAWQWWEVTRSDAFHLPDRR